MKAPDPATTFDHVAATYDEDGHHQHVAELLLTDLPATPTGPPDLVLDVATGTGAAAFTALRLLRPTGLLAVDISPRMVGRARERAAALDPAGRIDWRVAPAVPAPVGDGTVDLVLCASSYQFLGAAAFRDWLRVLRPGGCLAVTLPSAASFAPSPDFARLAPPDLVLPSDEGQAAEILARGGFDQVRVRGRDFGGDRPREVFLAHAVAPAARR
ncbi:class I SAM-dependent methyltransferase [Actinoalloteichus caeruleus]|uniref:class I SAM-dependent methyltransferase n=2 Tax=Actinoalloteichus cyanogriseus TaxID=2893586 RepID=UPI0005BE687C|nr:class I SAM-dependent methyltransferase [Actinoalloteichus caeruleus]